MRRRSFLQGVTAGLLGTGLAAASEHQFDIGSLRQINRKETIGTARNCIFILLEGGPSQVDTFDVKTSVDTPDLLGVQTLGGGFQWPVGTMPKLAGLADQFSLVRSISAVEAVHERAVYHLLTAHRQNAALTKDIPHFASMTAFKLANQRRESDVLPPVIVMGIDPAKNGFLDVDYQALRLNGDGSIPNLEHGYDGSERRFSLLENTLALSQVKDERNNLVRFQKQGLDLMNGSLLRDLLLAESSFEDPSFMVTEFRRQCETAVRLLGADQGTRVLQLQLGGWDHHFDIYNQEMGGLVDLSHALDEGLSYLLTQLQNLPGQQTGKSLLDETLIVAMGEFGRTTGELNSANGRDHYPYAVSGLFAGGGVQAGRIIGRTNPEGSTILDPGWSHNRFMGINDCMATIYSALGIDWTERFNGTPSGRIFELVDTSLTGPAYPIDALFS